MKKRYYLAYGSNLNLPQMRLRCPTARVVGTAMIEDYELLFKGSKTGSYLTIEKAKGGKVPVAVWEVQEKDEAELDRYEGYPTFYYKLEMHITFKGIKTGKERKRKAFVYIMHENRPLGFPSKHYVETCMVGYHTFGFDDNYLWDAIERSR
ncbi:MAG: gamma-glutamylcyclotransferase [Lachnospiraceae bacterium]|nr:gamma-glutamylcyclotransferase [Lachnospiraceae bacterium]